MNPILHSASQQGRYDVAALPPAPETPTEHMEKAITAIVQRALLEQPLREFVPLRFFIQDARNVYAMTKTEQSAAPFQAIKTLLLEKAHLPIKTPVIQVIGDSAVFSEEGTISAREFLYPLLQQEPSLILYGYTGHRNDGGKRLCVNYLVTEWIDNDPRRGEHVVANIVDEHTLVALRKWSCLVTDKVQNLYLVFGNAKFGDDIPSSDSITDKGICIEGGVQSFRQVVNFLSQNTPVFGIFGIRCLQDPKDFDATRGTYIRYFSAAEFLHNLFEYAKTKDLLRSDVELFRSEYLLSHHLYDPRRLDGGTKEALFQTAWDQFITQELWKKSSLCHFQKNKSD